MPRARRPPLRGPAAGTSERSVLRRRWLTAAGIWALLVLVYSMRREVRGEPFVWVSLTWGESFRTAVSQWTAWGLLLAVIIWLDRRLPVRRDALLTRLLCHVPLSVVFTVAYTYLYHAGLWALDVPRDPSLLAGGLVATTTRVMLRHTTFIYWVIVGTYIALDYQDFVKDRLVRHAELERLLAQARLSNLRAQLQPHFLFNALNTISVYVEEHPRQARQMLEQVGDLLRLSLVHSEAEEITLGEELQFVRRYLDLQGMRYERRLDVMVDSDPEVLGALVPPFILQPIVENAVRHAAAVRPAPTRVEISARRQNGAVHLSVRDDGPGLPENWSLEEHAGIGLSNTRERLAQLYEPTQHSFEVSDGPDAGVRVAMTVPFRTR